MMFDRLRGWLIEKLSGGTYRKHQERQGVYDRYSVRLQVHSDALSVLDAVYQSEIDGLNIRYKGVATRAIDSYHAAARRGLAENFFGPALHADTLTGSISTSTILDEGLSPRGSLNGVVLGPFKL